MFLRLTTLAVSIYMLSSNVVAVPVGGNATEIVARALGTTANDVVNRVCRSTTLIFARGTTESGNIGSVRPVSLLSNQSAELTIVVAFQTVGPALGDALISALGSSVVAVQGVDYAADVAGTVIGQTDPASAPGSIDCSSKITSLLSFCPNTRIVIAGYSQGAQQVHGCLLRLTQTQANSVRVRRLTCREFHSSC